VALRLSVISSQSQASIGFIEQEKADLLMFSMADVFPMPHDQPASRITGELDLPRGLVAHV
jgi:hypothetical protein